MIGILGAGSMGSAIACSLSKAGRSVAVYDPDPARSRLVREGSPSVLIAQNEKSLITDTDIVIIAVKPQGIEPVLKQIGISADPEKIIVSIAAGITTGYIERHLPFKAKVIRTMPNLAVKTERSVTALCRGVNSRESDLDRAVEIFDVLGATLRVDECDMDKITAVSGSGPGYIFYFLETFVKSVAKLGFTSEQAHKLVFNTFMGTASIARDGGEFSNYCAQVCSKGGTTEAGISAFADARLDNIFDDVLNRAVARASELGK